MVARGLQWKKISTGVLAHLARARHWQCRGERFESAILHCEEYRQACLRSSLIPKDPYLPNGDLGIRRGGFNSKDTSVYVARAGRCQCLVNRKVGVSLRCY